jgi:hypothetical protein
VYTSLFFLESSTQRGNGDNHRCQRQQETDSSTNAKNDDSARRWVPPRSIVLLFSTQRGGVHVHLLVVSFIIHVIDVTRRYQPPCCVVMTVFAMTRRYPPLRASCFQHSEEVPTSSLCHYSCFRHNEEVPTSSSLVIVVGNPWVFLSNPYPYPPKPIPTTMGMGFCGYGYGFL